MKSLLAVCCLLLMACGGESKADDAGYEGREETKKLHAIEAVGHDGDDPIVYTKPD